MINNFLEAYFATFMLKIEKKDIMRPLKSPTTYFLKQCNRLAFEFHISSDEICKLYCNHFKSTSTATLHCKIPYLLFLFLMIQVIFTMGQNQSRGNSKIALKPEETNPLAKTLAFTNESMTLCQIMNMFRWEEEIPNVQSQGYVFLDRIFEVKISKISKAIIFSASFTYDVTTTATTLKVKIVEGGELLTGHVIINLKYSCVTGGRSSKVGHFLSGVCFFNRSSWS